MSAGPGYHRPRRQDPAVKAQRRTYKAAYNRAMAKLRDQHRGQFAALLHAELAATEGGLR